MGETTVLRGSAQTTYRWSIIYSPSRSVFSLYMYRYEINSDSNRLDLATRAYLDPTGRWVPVEVGCASEPTLLLPDELVWELCKNGPLNQIEGTKLESTLIDFCTKIITGMVTDAEGE